MTSDTRIQVYQSQQIKLKNSLINAINRISSRSNAEYLQFPPLIETKGVSKFDFFENFPHLASCVSTINCNCLTDNASHEISSLNGVPKSFLNDSYFTLPTAACYNVYLYFENQTLNEDKCINTQSFCFRNEEYYNSERMYAFTMQEIVFLGSKDASLDHIKYNKELILEFASHLGLEVTVENADDPFFNKSASRTIMQSLFPTKQEILTQGKLAISSVNYHRNFFGERANIKTAKDEFCYTDCVAFGIDRWMYALSELYSNNPAKLIDRLNAFMS